MVTVYGSGIKDATGTLLPSGAFYWQPADAHGNPANFRFGNGGQGERTAATAPVINGAFTIQLPDTSLTTAQGLCGVVTVRTAVGSVVLGSKGYGYDCVQPAANNYWCTNGSCNFDLYQPNVMPIPPAPTAPGITGVPTVGNCAKFTTSTQIGDAGAPCGTGASGGVALSVNGSSLGVASLTVNGE